MSTMQSPMFPKSEKPIAAAAVAVGVSVLGFLLIVGGGFAVRFATQAAFAGLGIID